MKNLEYYLKQHQDLNSKVETLQNNTKENVKELLHSGEESLKEKIRQNISFAGIIKLCIILFAILLVRSLILIGN